MGTKDNKKEIKYLIVGNFGDEGYVSPTGRYLILANLAMLTIYDTQTNKSFILDTPANDYRKGHEKYYYFRNKISCG